MVGVTSPVVAALQRQTRSVPIVFVGVIDPVGAGLVASLARPGGNTTGFSVFEYGISPKAPQQPRQLSGGTADPQVRGANDSSRPFD